MRTATIALLVMALCVLSTEAFSYKKQYCDNEEYVGNEGSKKPHVHCGKNFFTMSWSDGHDNLVTKDGARCNKVKEILSSPNRYAGAASPEEITNALTAFKRGECKKLNLLRRLLFRILLDE